MQHNGGRRWPGGLARQEDLVLATILPVGTLLGEKFGDRHLEGDGEPVKYVHRNISGLALHVGDERTVDPAPLGEIIL
jgi:hypothetical protein